MMVTCVLLCIEATKQKWALSHHSAKIAACVCLYFLHLTINLMVRSPDLKYSYVTIALQRYSMEVTEQSIVMCSLLYTVLNNKKIKAIQWS